MSALAHILLDLGCQVFGEDSKSNSRMKELENRGASIFSDHDPKRLVPGMVVIYSSAILPDHIQMQKARALRLETYSRRELFPRLFRDKKLLAVTGTHGKTSTSALLAHIFSTRGSGTGYLIGGEVPTLERHGRRDENGVMVIEADESDGSFLGLKPLGAIVTNIDIDHLDYWKSSENLVQGFQTFVERVQNPNLLFYAYEDPLLREICPHGQSYGFEIEADFQVVNPEYHPGFISFSMQHQGVIYSDLKIHQMGRHSVLNAAAAFAFSLKWGLTVDEIRKGLGSFRGIKRRLECLHAGSRIDIYDDYAHHPTEVESLLTTLAHFSNGRKVLIFQPHRYTRFKEHMHRFARAFEGDFELVVTDIYSAGESPVGVDIHQFLELFGAHSRVHYASREQLTDFLAGFIQEGDFVMSVGAGDVREVTKALALQCERSV